MRKVFSIFILLTIGFSSYSQFAPAAGEPGSTAIYKDDVSFVGWAKTCKVTRGFINISDTTRTFTQGQVTSNRAFFGKEEMALGRPGGPLDCISLGDGGSAVLTFDFPIRNGEGADFAVFENGIKEQEAPFQYFLELAFVEVSTDGRRFVRFPATSNTPAKEQLLSFGQIDPTKIHNLAGKYVSDYGTPFDLQDLIDSTGINLDSINFVRIIDVVGNIQPQFARYDSKKQVINDPFPTEFWSGGFDLDAVGAIHLNGITAVPQQESALAFKVYPNPVSSGNSVIVEGIPNSQLELWSPSGRKVLEKALTESEASQIDLPELKSGLYFLYFRTTTNFKTVKLLVE
ncbi:MAG TPA: T9SS type A sorting domain-containing protein [Bacteroidales bacterium]|nr:T9SS type A sorting domain-containing protein [Bacteroidales bacterium]